MILRVIKSGYIVALTAGNNGVYSALLIIHCGNFVVVAGYLGRTIMYGLAQYKSLVEVSCTWC